MTFDEALDELKREAFWSTGFPEIQEIEFEKVKYAVEKLREEYAPTVNMRHQQIKIFASYYHPENPFDLDKFDFPDNLLMKGINKKELMIAWLHPETIKVIGETNDTATSSRNED